MAPKIADFNEGWGEMERAFAKLQMILEGSTETKFSGEEYMNLHTTIYDMCTQKPPFDFSMRLYHKYKEAMDGYNSSVVLPSVRGKHSVFMLRELVQRWLNHKVLVRWLSHFLHHLDRFLPARRLPTLKVVGLTSFCEMVYMEARDDVTETMLALIHHDRENQQVDRLLLKNIVDIFVEIDRGKMECHKNDFEMHMLDSTEDYYRFNSAIWIQANTPSDYMQNAEICLRREKKRLSQYLHSSTEQKLIERVQNELLVNHANHLLEIEYCSALLRNEEMDDLSRIVRIYEKIPGVLDEVLIHVVDVFKQTITDQGTIFITLAEEDATNQKTTAGGSGFQDQNQDQASPCARFKIIIIQHFRKIK